MRALLVLFAATLGAQPALDKYLTGLAEAGMQGREAELKDLSRASLQKRQTYIREHILASIGGLPSARPPLNARVTGGFDRPGYRVENVVFESQPKLYVTANLYLPKSGKAPYPALVGVAGHSANGKASATYQHVWITMAKRGFAVLAFDPQGQGERSELLDEATGLSRPGIGVNEHITIGLQCLLAGGHAARYEIWDGMRAVDYLISRKEVDPARIAVAGNSGGGTQAAYLAALEPRLAAAVSSCYMTSWRQLWYKPGPQDAEQVFPNFLRDRLDLADFAFSFSPKPFLMTTAIQDFFPITGARAAYQQIRDAYQAQDAVAKAGYFEYDDTHGWSKPRREAAYRFLERWLQGRESDVPEGDVETEPEQSLYATTTGQVRTSLGGETTQSLNAVEARRVYEARTAASRELDRTTVFTRASVPASAPPLYDFSLQLPQANGAKPPIVVALNAAKEDIAGLLNEGFAVLGAQFGVSASGRPESGYTAQYHLASRAFLVGQTIVGMQVANILRAVKQVAEDPRLDSRSIRIYARGNPAVAALHAAFLSNVKSVALEAMPLSWLAITQAKMHRGLAETVIPGVLHDYDLPDLARSIEGGKLWLADTRDPVGGTVLLDRVKKDYPRAHVIYRPEGWTFSQVYRDWLR